MSASPGAGGGLRAMNTLRQFLQLTIGMLVVPDQFALARAASAFDEATGALQDAAAQASVTRVLAGLTRVGLAMRD